MPTERQRDTDRRLNEEADAALAEFEASHWPLSISEKAAFLSGFMAHADIGNPKEYDTMLATGVVPHSFKHRFRSRS